MMNCIRNSVFAFFVLKAAPVLSQECSSLMNGTILKCENLKKFDDLDAVLLKHTQVLIITNVEDVTIQRSSYKENYGKLKSCIISNNSNLQIMEDAFSGLTNIVFININNNKWENIYQNSFRGLENLELLDISKNNIKQVHSDAFNGLRKLKTLILKMNDLESLPSRTFQKLERLEELSLSNNQIKTLDPEAFHGLRGLRKLSLAHNDLHTIDLAMLSKLSSLEDLNLSFNRIKNLKGRLSIPNLKFLDFNNNQLETLESHVFEGCQQMESIEMENNNLANTNEVPFMALSNLKLLNLRNNGIKIEDFSDIKKHVLVVY